MKARQILRERIFLPKVNVKLNFMSAKKITAIDLFCGAGGSSCGAQTAGANIIAAFDKWDLAGRTHAANFPNTRVYQGALEEQNVSMLARELGSIDLILASQIRKP